MAEQTSFSEAIGAVMTAFMSKQFTSRPAKVKAYDKATQKVDVTMALSENIVTDDEVVNVKTADIFGVPVAFPRGGGFSFTMPITEGDYVLLVFADRSIDLWLENGGSNVDPIDIRRHAVGDAIAIPGCYPNPDALSDADDAKMRIGYDGGIHMEIDDAGNMILAAIGASTQAVALAGKVDDELQKIVTAHNTHIHITTATVGPTPVLGTIAPTTVTYTKGPVGSSKVKAEV